MYNRPDKNIKYHQIYLLELTGKVGVLNDCYSTTILYNDQQLFFGSLKCVCINKLS